VDVRRSVSLRCGLTAQTRLNGSGSCLEWSRATLSEAQHYPRTSRFSCAPPHATVNCISSSVCPSVRLSVCLSRRLLLSSFLCKGAAVRWLLASHNSGVIGSQSAIICENLQSNTAQQSSAERVLQSPRAVGDELAMIVALSDR